MPSGNGSTPTNSSVSLLYSDTCPSPAMAISGAHGLLAMAVIALARVVWTIGSVGRLCGIGGGPAGRPLATDVSERLYFGLETATLLPEFSGAPFSIQMRMSSSDSLGRGGDLGGMNGSCWWLTSL